MGTQLSVKRLLEEGASVGPVLGLDTGGPVASLGVVAGGQIRAVLSRSLASHCAGLPAAVEEVLETADLTMQDLAGVAIAIGPGSFTGLRVGLSYAKGMIMASSMAIVGVSTLDAMALCALGGRLKPGISVCPVLDARKGEVYTGLYRFIGDALERATEDLVIPLANLTRQIDGEVAFVGESKAEEARLLVEANGRRTMLVGTAELHLRGSFVAAIGAARLARNEADVAATLEPLYVRAPDASVNSSSLRSGEDAYGTPRGRTHPAASGS
jgi:tRNA threonylcarbamoyladenosine biosynthesis protein TsaB